MHLTEHSIPSVRALRPSQTWQGKLRRWFVEHLRTIPARYSRHRELRRCERALLALDDRVLKDMGIARGEIGSVVWGAVGERNSALAWRDRIR